MRFEGRVWKDGKHWLIEIPAWAGRSGRPTPPDECEGLLETLDLLADPAMSEAVRRGFQEVAEGDLVSHETLWNELDDQVVG